jgi:amino acid permease
MDENQEKKEAIETTYHRKGSDVESSSVKDDLAYGDGKLVRQLKNRHVAMIRCAACTGLSNYPKLMDSLVSVVLSELVSIPH